MCSETASWPWLSLVLNWSYCVQRADIALHEIETCLTSAVCKASMLRAPTDHTSLWLGLHAAALSSFDPHVRTRSGHTSRALTLEVGCFQSLHWVAPCVCNLMPTAGEQCCLLQVRITNIPPQHWTAAPREPACMPLWGVGWTTVRIMTSNSFCLSWNRDS